MLMIFPERCGIMYLIASWASSNAAVRLTAIIGSHLLLSKEPTLSSRLIPAELTRMSTEPKVSAHSSTTRAHTPGWVMSTVISSNRRPSASISRRVVPSSAAMLGTNRFAPAFASATANACPRPLLPPVTTAFFPVNENRSMLKDPTSIHAPFVLCPAEGVAARRVPRSSGQPRRNSAELPGCGDVLVFEVFVDAFEAAFPADAGLFDPAEGGGGVGDEAAVQSDHADVETFRDPQAPGEVGGVHEPEEPVLGGVGDGDGLVVVVDRNDRRDRSEDLVDRHR